MRTTLLVTAFGAVFLAWGCGGKVVLDRASEGAGGGTGGTAGDGGSSGSSVTSSSATSSSSSSGGSITCDLACGGPVGICGCEGPCSDGNKRAVGCGGAAETGFSCTCVLNGDVVGMCDEPSLICGLPNSCCQAVFGL